MRLKDVKSSIKSQSPELYMNKELWSNLFNYINFILETRLNRTKSSLSGMYSYLIYIGIIKDWEIKEELKMV